jgi:hypothetical protein
VKNYVRLWLAGQNDGMNPPALLTYGFFFSKPEADDYINANGWNAGPNPYYFLLSKFNLATLVSAYPWNVDAQASLGTNPGVFTQDVKQADDWGGKSKVWNSDAADKFSVQAAKSATKTRRTVKSGDFSGAQGLLDALASLPALAAQLTKAGRLRDAGIVIYAYEQVIKRYWSITQAFAYLVANRIL